MTDRSVLVVSAAPDHRSSTVALRRLVDDLSATAGLRVAVWFLRDGPDRAAWPEARVIDDLRTWAPVAAARRLHLEPLASALGGARLRSWRRQVAADVAVLDDGLGGRVLGSAPTAAVVVRRTAAAPAIDGGEGEGPWTGPVLGTIDGRPAPIGEAGEGGGAPGAGPWTVHEPPAAAPLAPPRLGPEAVRSLLGLPGGRTVVAWVGEAPGEAHALGPALDLVRRLEAEHGLVVDLVAAAPHLGQGELAAIAADARTAGLTGRIHARPLGGLDALSGCDAVVAAPGALADDLADALRAAGTVVAGPEPAALASQLAVDRGLRVQAAAHRRDRGRFADELAAALGAAGRYPGPMTGEGRER